MFPIELKKKIINIIECDYGFSLKAAMIKNNIDINYLIYLTSFLPENSGIPERIYCIVNDINRIQTCIECCNNKVRFKRLKVGYSRFCSEKCMANSTSVKEKRKTFNIEKYGCENVFQSEKIKNKSKQTCIDKYGVENASQSITIKNKKIETCLKNYGVEFPFQSNINIEKSKKTCMDKYGVDNVWKSDEIILKIKNTHILKYGVECKPGYKYKDYILPSGKEVKIQGYENKFLDEYFLNGGNENNILITIKDITAKIGKIYYYDLFNKKHIYHPDIYLINENKIIEVKSNWTYFLHETINLCKKDACLDKGFNFEFKIYGGAK